MKAKDRKDNVTSGKQLVEDIKYVIETIESVVGSTLGAGGDLVLATNQFFGKPSLSKDGIHALANIQFRDTRYDMIHQIFVEAINKTAKQSGDGRTTSTLIACDLIKRGLDVFDELDSEGAAKLIDEAVRYVTNEAKQLSEDKRQPLGEGLEYLASNPQKPEEESLADINKNLYDIAMVSSNGDKYISTAISAAMERVGMTGLVTANLSHSSSLDIEYADGLIFYSGYIDEVFSTNLETMTTEFEYPMYLISKTELNDPEAVAHIVASTYQSKRPLVIMAEKFGRAFIKQMAQLRVDNNLAIALIDPYKYTDRRISWLNDMGVSLNATVFDGVTKKIADCTGDDLGSSDSIIINSSKTSIVGPHTDPEVLESYRKKLDSLAEQELSDFNREKIRERIAHLTGALALISVGAESETLAMERLARCQDALNSCLHASKHGFVDGGGASLYRAGIYKPLDTILDNAGIKEGGKSIILDHVNQNKGYDLRTLEESESIIDSLMTVVNGLNNAKAIVKAVLSIKHILDLPDADKAKQE